jgi:2-polyprenyl-3-methyl-5-hydroxy-6-metoxy-1,4-benzoquinol methylase
LHFKNVILKKTSCIICNQANHKKLFSAKYLLFNLKGKYNVIKCNNCNLIRTDPMPTIGSMKYYYPKNYSPYIDTQLKRKQNNFKAYIKKITNFFFDAKGQFIPSLPVGNILDIGCASGFFLYEMKKKGWKTFGIETSKHAANYAKKILNLNVYNGPIEKAKKPNCKSLDLIVGWMTIEHLHNPIFVLKKIRSWSNKSTYLVLSIPNADSFEFNLFKKYWYALQVPTHAHHFTPETIKKVLKIGGWNIQRIIYQRSISNIIASLGHILEFYGYKKIGKSLIYYTSNPGMFNYFFYPFSYILAIFKQSGRITIWAKLN